MGVTQGLAWATRRYIYIRLQHDERGNPMQRKLLKLKKMAAQKDAGHVGIVPGLGVACFEGSCGKMKFES
jgi:hypothetical protein